LVVKRKNRIFKLKRLEEMGVMIEEKGKKKKKQADKEEAEY
jgi:hypothetical protein